MKKTSVWFLLLALVLPAWAQPNSSAQREEMKKLDYMIGQWRGEGWMERNGQRHTFSGTETVQSKLGGIALLIEGLFNSKPAGSEEMVPVHETLAVLSYDEKAKVYRFRTYLATGMSGDCELQVITGGWPWGMHTPQGHIRYTFRLNEKGEWLEVGEFSQDGQTWRQFFEMTLRRQQ